MPRSMASGSSTFMSPPPWPSRTISFCRVTTSMPPRSETRATTRWKLIRAEVERSEQRPWPGDDLEAETFLAGAEVARARRAGTPRSSRTGCRSGWCPRCRRRQRWRSRPLRRGRRGTVGCRSWTGAGLNSTGRALRVKLPTRQSAARARSSPVDGRAAGVAWRPRPTPWPGRRRPRSRRTRAVVDLGDSVLLHGNGAAGRAEEGDLEDRVRLRVAGVDGVAVVERRACSSACR